MMPEYKVILRKKLKDDPEKSKNFCIACKEIILPFLPFFGLHLMNQKQTIQSISYGSEENTFYCGVEDLEAGYWDGDGIGGYQSFEELKDWYKIIGWNLYYEE